MKFYRLKLNNSIHSKNEPQCKINSQFKCHINISRSELRCSITLEEKAFKAACNIEQNEDS